MSSDTQQPLLPVRQNGRTAWVIAIVILVLILTGLVSLVRFKSGSPSPTGDLTATTSATNLGDPRGTGFEGVPEGTMPVRLYFARLNDNGQTGKPIGCGDSIVSKTVYLPLSLTHPLEDSLVRLLNYAPANGIVPGTDFYTVVASTTLARVTIASSTAQISLKGSAGAGICDTPRFLAQIQETALQFPTVRDVQICLNGFVYTGSEKGDTARCSF